MLGNGVTCTTRLLEQVECSVGKATALQVGRPDVIHVIFPCRFARVGTLASFILNRLFHLDRPIWRTTRGELTGNLPVDMANIIVHFTRDGE